MNLTHMMCYTEIKVLNANILLLNFISSSAFNTEKDHAAVFTTLSKRTIRIFPAYSVSISF